MEGGGGRALKLNEIFMREVNITKMDSSQCCDSTVAATTTTTTATTAAAAASKRPFMTTFIKKL